MSVYQVGDVVTLKRVVMDDAGGDLKQRIGQNATVVVVPPHPNWIASVEVRFDDMDESVLLYETEIEKAVLS